MTGTTRTPQGNNGKTEAENLALIQSAPTYTTAQTGAMSKADLDKAIADFQPFVDAASAYRAQAGGNAGMQGNALDQIGYTYNQLMVAAKSK